MPLRLSKQQAKSYGFTVPKAKAKTRTTRRADGYASQLEADYAQHLRQEQEMGLILRWVYEPWQFVLVPGSQPVRYKPDFIVIPKRGKWEIREIKGRWRPRDRVVMKLCAHKWPEFRVIGVMRVRGVWTYEQFSR